MGEFEQAANNYRKLMALLDKRPEKKPIVIQVYYAMQFAHLAYVAAYSANKMGAGHASAIMEAGAFANCYLINEEYIRKTLLGGVGRNDVCAKMQAVSDFIERFDIPAIPREISVNGIDNKINKTAAEVHDDMEKYLAAMHELRRSIEAINAETERRK